MHSETSIRLLYMAAGIGALTDFVAAVVSLDMVVPTVSAMYKWNAATTNKLLCCMPSTPKMKPVEEPKDAGKVWSAETSAHFWTVLPRHSHQPDRVTLRMAPGVLLALRVVAVFV